MSAVPPLILDEQGLVVHVREPTVAAFTDMAPDVLVPAHCTGWKAQHRLAAALPTAFVPNAIGTSFVPAGSAA